MLCKTFRGPSYITDYFIIRLSEMEYFNSRDLKSTLEFAILDDLMNLYAADRFAEGKHD